MPTKQLQLLEPFKSKFVSGEYCVKMEIVCLYDGESETPFEISHDRYLKSIFVGRILSEEEYKALLLNPVPQVKNAKLEITLDPSKFIDDKDKDSLKGINALSIFTDWLKRLNKKKG